MVTQSTQNVFQGAGGKTGGGYINIVRLLWCGKLPIICTVKLPGHANHGLAQPPLQYTGSAPT